MCHHNTFLVYQSMRDASLERWEKVTHISLGFAWAVAALFGIAGYSTFRALSQGTSRRWRWWKCISSGRWMMRILTTWTHSRGLARELLLGRRFDEFQSRRLLLLHPAHLSIWVLRLPGGKDDNDLMTHSSGGGGGHLTCLIEHLNLPCRLWKRKLIDGRTRSQLIMTRRRIPANKLRTTTNTRCPSHLLLYSLRSLSRRWQSVWDPC